MGLPVEGYCRVAIDDPLHGPYHDDEYGFPVESDAALFERLVLEINQAGLSWATILRKRAGFREAYRGFDIDVVVLRQHVVVDVRDEETAAAQVAVPLFLELALADALAHLLATVVVGRGDLARAFALHDVPAGFGLERRRDPAPRLRLLEGIAFVRIYAGD